MKLESLDNIENHQQKRLTHCGKKTDEAQIEIYVCCVT